MKIIGILLILSSDLMTAFFQINKELLHYRHLNDIIHFLEMIKRQASHYSDSLKTIAENNQVNDIAKLFVRYCDAGEEPVAAWKTAVSKSEMKLTVNEKKHIEAFGTDICSSTAEFITENSDRNIEELYKIKKICESDKNRRIKLTATLTVSVGILIILILI